MKRLIAITIIAICTLSLIQGVYAAVPDIYLPGETQVLPTATGGYAGDRTTVDTILDEIMVPFLNLFSNVLIGLAVVFLVAGGLQYVLAHGDEEKIKKAHRSIVWAVFGILLVMFSYTIVYVVNTLITPSA